MLASFLAPSLALAQQGYIPDHERTPGAINPDTTQDNIAQTVCLSGYTNTIRPPSSYTSRLKARQMRELNLPGTAHDYHEDHMVPLCVGGHPSDPRNLWPEPVDGQWSARVKDQLESSVCRQVCRGDISLEQGQAIFLRPDQLRWRLQRVDLESPVPEVRTHLIDNKAQRVRITQLKPALAPEDLRAI